MCTVGLRAEWHSGVLNRKVTDRIIDGEMDEKLLLNRIIEQYVKRISERAAVSRIETTVNCTAAFSIHYAAIFELFHVASISVSSHGHIAQSTVRKFLLHIQPLVQKTLALLSPC